MHTKGYEMRFTHTNILYLTVFMKMEEPLFHGLRRKFWMDWLFYESIF